MAVFKVTSYTKSRGGAKASIRYIESRPGKEGKRLTRALFGADGVMTREQALGLMDEVKKGSLFYRLVVSPNPCVEDSRRDLPLWEITQQIMQTLEERLKQEIAWVAAEHDDHTPNRHVHIVAVLKGRLKVQDLAFLRLSATQAVLSRRQQLDLNRDPGLTRGNLHGQRDRRANSKLTRAKTGAALGGSGGVIPSSSTSLVKCICPNCWWKHSKHAEDRVHRCNSCGQTLHQGSRLQLSRKEGEWER
jgi:hypothetical protein